MTSIKGKNLEDNFEHAVKCLPLVWLYDQKEQKKTSFSPWIMKKFDEFICLISSRLNEGFQMKKDQTIAGEKI